MFADQKDTVKKKGRRQKQDGILSTTNLFEDTNTMDDTSASMRPRRAAARVCIFHISNIWFLIIYS